MTGGSPPEDKKPRRNDAGISKDLAEFLKQPSKPANVSLLLAEDIPPVELTSLNKVYWPEEGYTKGDLIAYYLKVSRYIMPYLENRPAILIRYPNGIKDGGFFQHDIASSPSPQILRTAELESESGRRLHYGVYGHLASLIYLANLGTIAQNPWHSRIDSLDQPDYMVFDLDPHGAPFENVVRVALEVKQALSGSGLEGYIKTSGSTGLHIYVPLKTGCSYPQVSDFAQQLAARVARALPKIATVERRLAEREKEQVYVDWLQNARGKSAASVYTVRARPGATVSAPLDWKEVEQGSFKLADFNIATMPLRLKEVGDIWQGFFNNPQNLPEA